MNEVKSFNLWTGNTQQFAGQSQQMKWWHCAIIFVVANIISIVPAGFNGDEAFYNNFLQPSVAPPDWLFPPMWLFLNITSLIGLYTVANLPKETPYRKSVIILEYTAWVLFAIFAFLYFYLKSPILAAINTVAGFVIIIAVLLMTYKISKKSFWFFLPRLLWLALASYVSVWIVLKNKDVFFNVGPF